MHTVHAYIHTRTQFLEAVDAGGGACVFAILSPTFYFLPDRRHSCDKRIPWACGVALYSLQFMIREMSINSLLNTRMSSGHCSKGTWGILSVIVFIYLFIC